MQFDITTDSLKGAKGALFMSHFCNLWENRSSYFDTTIHVNKQNLHPDIPQLRTLFNFCFNSDAINYTKAKAGYGVRYMDNGDIRINMVYPICETPIKGEQVKVFYLAWIPSGNGRWCYMLWDDTAVDWDEGFAVSTIFSTFEEADEWVRKTYPEATIKVEVEPEMEKKVVEYRRTHSYGGFSGGTILVGGYHGAASSYDGDEDDEDDETPVVEPESEPTTVQVPVKNDEPKREPAKQITAEFKKEDIDDSVAARIFFAIMGVLMADPRFSGLAAQAASGEKMQECFKAIKDIVAEEVATQIAAHPVKEEAKMPTMTDRLVALIVKQHQLVEQLVGNNDNITEETQKMFNK